MYDVDISETDGAAFAVAERTGQPVFLNPAHDFRSACSTYPKAMAGMRWWTVVNGKVREEHFHLRPLNATP